MAPISPGHLSLVSVDRGIFYALQKLRWKSASLLILIRFMNESCMLYIRLNWIRQICPDTKAGQHVTISFHPERNFNYLNAQMKKEIDLVFPSSHTWIFSEFAVPFFQDNIKNIFWVKKQRFNWRKSFKDQLFKSLTKYVSEIISRWLATSPYRRLSSWFVEWINEKPESTLEAQFWLFSPVEWSAMRLTPGLRDTQGHTAFFFVYVFFLTTCVYVKCEGRHS